MKNIAQSTGSRGSISHFTPTLLFSLLAAISLALWWKALASTFSLALNDDQYTHILLILPISAALILLDWKSLEQHFQPSFGIGSLMVLALGFNVAASKIFLSSPDIQLSLKMMAFVVWVIAAFLLCFGVGAFRRELFPLLFLLWFIPLPEFAVNAIVNFLQQTSAVAAHWIFALARIPVEQRGLLIHIPGLTLEVAPECSSIRSSMILVVTTMVLAHLLLRSLWRKVLLVAVSIPLAIVKNGLRIFVLGFLAIRVDRSYLTGRLHYQGGFIYFFIALAAVIALLWVLRRKEATLP